jgi:hypothetical protein
MQVQRLLMSFDYFYQITCKVLFISFMNLKSKYCFYNYKYDYVVSNEIMSCADGGGSIATEYIFR